VTVAEIGDYSLQCGQGLKVSKLREDSQQLDFTAIWMSIRSDEGRGNFKRWVFMSVTPKSAGSPSERQGDDY